MPFGRSDAGLDSFSDYRASVVQRMRKFSRAQHVVSTIICWCFHSSGVGGDFDVKQGGFFAEQALQPAHEPYRHTGTLPAPQWYCRRRASFPRLIESLVPECWRDLIVAGRGRKSSTGFGTPAIASPRELAAVYHKYRTGYRCSCRTGFVKLSARDRCGHFNSPFTFSVLCLQIV
jgi:hypothetical protein